MASDTNTDAMMKEAEPADAWARFPRALEKVAEVLRASLERRKRDLAALDAQLEGLRQASSEAAKKSLAVLEQRRTELDAEVAELQGALPELEGLGEAAEAAKGAALAEKKGLQATLEAEVAKALELRADLSGAKEKLREAGNTIAQQEEDLAKLREALAERDQELEALRAEVQKTAAERDRLQEELERRSETVAELERVVGLLSGGAVGIVDAAPPADEPKEEPAAAPAEEAAPRPEEPMDEWAVMPPPMIGEPMPLTSPEAAPEKEEAAAQAEEPAPEEAPPAPAEALAEPPPTQPVEPPEPEAAPEAAAAEAEPAARGAAAEDEGDKPPVDAEDLAWINEQLRDYLGSAAVAQDASPDVPEAAKNGASLPDATAMVAATDRIIEARDLSREEVRIAAIIAHQPYTVEEIARIAGLDVDVVREGVGRFAAEGWVEFK